MDPEPAVGIEAERARARDHTLSPLALGLLTLSLMLAYFWLSGTLFSSDVSGFSMSSAQASGAALTYSTIAAFLLAGLRYAQHQTDTVLDQLVSSGTLVRETATPRGPTWATMSPAQNVAATIVGLILGSLNVSWQDVANDLGGPTIFMTVSMAVGNLVTWLVVGHVVPRRILVSNTLRRLGREHAKVDLLRLDALLPFGRMGALDVLIVAIAVSLTAFQSLDAELRWYNYSFAFSAGVPIGLTLLLLPMIGIRSRVRQAKQSAIEKLDEAIAQANRDLEPDPLRYLADLLRQREAIQHAREWPLDTTALSRVAIYFVIPPLAWVGGALVEILIGSVISPSP